MRFHAEYAEQRKELENEGRIKLRKMPAQEFENKYAEKNEKGEIKVMEKLENFVNEKTKLTEEELTLEVFLNELIAEYEQVAKELMAM